MEIHWVCNRFLGFEGFSIIRGLGYSFAEYGEIQNINNCFFFFFWPEKQSKINTHVTFKNKYGRYSESVFQREDLVSYPDPNVRDVIL